MRAYVSITGVIFLLIVAAHVWRMLEESPRLARDPHFVLLTLLAALLSVWAARLLWRARTH